MSGGVDCWTGRGMKQLTLAAVGFERYAKTTRRAAFLGEMERVVPWSGLCALIEPFYPKPGNGRPPSGIERMLRIYFLQQWFSRSDPAVVATPANVADSTVLPELLHGHETRVWGDQAYRGQRTVIREHAPKAQDFTNRRYRHRGIVDEVERGKNRTKSRVRARVEHSIGVIKRVFGFRYRGLKKNTHRLLVTCALANLFMMRRHLLRCQRA